MRNKAANVLLGCVVATIAGLVLLVYGHARSERQSHIMNDVNRLKEVYVHWKQSGQPAGAGLVSALASYDALYQRRYGAWPYVFTDLLSVKDSSTGCLFALNDTNWLTGGLAVLTAKGQCYFLPEAGQAVLLADFEGEHRGLLNRKCGPYALSRQSSAPANGSQPFRLLVNTNSVATGSRR